MKGKLIILIILLVIISIVSGLKIIKLPCGCDEPGWWYGCYNTSPDSELCIELKNKQDDIKGVIDDGVTLVKKTGNVITSVRIPDVSGAIDDTVGKIGDIDISGAITYVSGLSIGNVSCPLSISDIWDILWDGFKKIGSLIYKYVVLNIYKGLVWASQMLIRGLNEAYDLFYDLGMTVFSAGIMPFVDLMSDIIRSGVDWTYKFLKDSVAANIYNGIVIFTDMLSSGITYITDKIIRFFTSDVASIIYDGIAAGLDWAANAVIHGFKHSVDAIKYIYTDCIKAGFYGAINLASKIGDEAKKLVCHIGELTGEGIVALFSLADTGIDWIKEHIIDNIMKGSFWAISYAARFIDEGFSWCSNAFEVAIKAGVNAVISVVKFIASAADDINWAVMTVINFAVNNYKWAKDAVQDAANKGYEWAVIAIDDGLVRGATWAADVVSNGAAQGYEWGADRYGDAQKIIVDFAIGVF